MSAGGGAKNGIIEDVARALAPAAWIVADDPETYPETSLALAEIYRDKSIGDANDVLRVAVPHVKREYLDRLILRAQLIDEACYGLNSKSLINWLRENGEAND